MTSDKSLFVKFESKEGGDVTFGDNSKGKIKGLGSIGNNKTSIHNVLLVDGLKHNLLSINQLRDKDCRVTFEKDSCKVIDINNDQIKFIGYRHGNVYVDSFWKRSCNLLLLTACGSKLVVILSRRHDC
ncbi:hypothetical protein CFOL_v3_08168 [Cephalotus follicularis]|uniref:Retrovirus-related Pol polyprotein from transposon TNT 1-94-like beta-barrel domain-containing protein n=1 Tax=Cephalotus follicularis TaxID=3775 RepID=A0A1Q3B9K0_CEPFO|nr:hypothetical protein CFOL_v3_08168 [Cephalotus follicularis]